MATSVQKLVGEPVAIVTYTPPFNIERDLFQAREQLAEISKKVSGTLHIVIDVSRLDLSFSDIMIGMGESSGARLEEINAGDVSMSFIGSPDMLQMVKDAYQQEQYGGMKVDIYGTLDEALDAIRG